MKKLLLILLCLPLLFNSCKKEEDNTPTNNTGNNNGNNIDTFLSTNDGTVWVCQDCHRYITTIIGGLTPDGNSLTSRADSLIGFYDGINFLYRKWKDSDTIPCVVKREVEVVALNYQCEIITNTSGEFEFSESFETSHQNQYYEIGLSYKFIPLGNNQLLLETRMINNSSQPDPGIVGSNIYIRSTTLQNLSCN